MDEMFDEFHPEYYFIGMNDFFDAIEKFIEDKRIDILITIPRQYSFLSRILKEKHTRKLAYYSHIPILESIALDILTLHQVALLALGVVLAAIISRRRADSSPTTRTEGRMSA